MQDYRRMRRKRVCNCGNFSGTNPLAVPGVLAYARTFTDAEDAVHNAVVLEEVAFMAYHRCS